MDRHVVTPVSHPHEPSVMIVDRVATVMCPIAVLLQYRQAFIPGLNFIDMDWRGAIKLLRERKHLSEQRHPQAVHGTSEEVNTSPKLVSSATRSLILRSPSSERCGLSKKGHL